MARTGVYGFLSILRAENAQLRSSLDGARKVIEYGVQAVDTDYINHNRAGLSNWYQVASAYIASHPKDGEK
jgi:hypothetical protein